MLCPEDDLPLHAGAVPLGAADSAQYASHPFRYDRYWFSGHSPDGGLYFVGALGVYANAKVMDAAFMVASPVRQEGLIASRPLDGAVLPLQVGPIEVEVVQPLRQLRFRVGAPAPGAGQGFGHGPACEPANGLMAELVFTAAAAPVVEPRYTYAHAGHTVIDLTRMTQGGSWQGTLQYAGHTVQVDGFRGTRDRSWGMRPIGRRPPPAPGTPVNQLQWYWLWVPLEFAGYSLLFHTNDDAAGVPWNRAATLVPHAGGIPWELQEVTLGVTYHPGTRRIARVVMSGRCEHGVVRVEAVPEWTACLRLAGYNHPTHGHGTAHGEPVVHYEALATAEVSPNDPRDLHVQSPCSAVLWLPDGTRHAGRGMVEQMLLGPHAPSGFASFLDAAPMAAGASDEGQQ